MKDMNKTKAQLIEELETLRERNRTLEHSEAARAQEMGRLELIARAAEQSTEGMAIVDLEGNLLFLNKAFANMHGYDPDELIGKNLSIFHTPEQIPSVNAANRELREKGTFSGEIWHTRRDGTVFPTWMENSLFRDPDGNPIGMIGTVGDITELKRTEEALRASEQKFRAIFDQTYQFIGLLDFETEPCWRRIGQPWTSWDSRKRMCSAGRSGKRDGGRIRPNCRSECASAVHRGGAGEFVRFEAYHPDRDGEIHTLDFSLRPVKDSAGERGASDPGRADISDYGNGRGGSERIREELPKPRGQCACRNLPEKRRRGPLLRESGPR